MMCLVIVRGHVPGRGVVTAEGHATGLTRTQMQPSAVLFNAFFTDIGLGGFDVSDGAEVLAQVSILTHTLKLRVLDQSRAIFFPSTSRMAVDRVNSWARRK